MILTEYQKKALKILHDSFQHKWFTNTEMWDRIEVAGSLHRPHFTLRKLHERGALKREVGYESVGQYAPDYWKFQIVEEGCPVCNSANQ